MERDRLNFLRDETLRDAKLPLRRFVLAFALAVHRCFVSLALAVTSPLVETRLNEVREDSADEDGE